MKNFSWPNFSLRKYLPSDEVFPETRVTAFLNRVGSLAQRYPALVILAFALLLILLFIPFLYFSLPGQRVPPSNVSRKARAEERRFTQDRLENRTQRPLPVNRQTVAGNWIGLSKSSSGDNVARWMAFNSDGEYQVLQGSRVGLGRWDLSGQRKSDAPPELTVQSRFYTLQGGATGPSQTKVFRVRVSEGEPRRMTIPPSGERKEAEIIYLSGRELHLSVPTGDTYVFARPQEGTFEEMPPPRAPSEATPLGETPSQAAPSGEVPSGEVPSSERPHPLGQ